MLKWILFHVGRLNGLPEASGRYGVLVPACGRGAAGSSLRRPPRSTRHPGRPFGQPPLPSRAGAYPHGSLKGAIPLERYLNPGFTPAPPDFKAARAQRIEENRKTNCRLECKGPECRS